jgi:hypothetical protein
VSEEEIETVAQELAKAGGLAWYPGRMRDALPRVVSNRYRDRARVAIAAIDRLRAGGGGTLIGPAEPPNGGPAAPVPGEALQVGSIVVYRPPGDQRAITCRVDKIENGQAYLVPCPKPDVGWVPINGLSAEDPDKT